MEHEIKQKETEGKGMFYIEKDNDIIAELTYTLDDSNIMTLDHSETEPEYTGKGLASSLVKHAVEYARENNIRIDPLCEYASIQFERHQEYNDVKASED